jgi:hypothetical protein
LFLRGRSSLLAFHPRVETRGYSYPSLSGFFSFFPRTGESEGGFLFRPQNQLFFNLVSSQTVLLLAFLSPG